LLNKNVHKNLRLSTRPAEMNPQISLSVHYVFTAPKGTYNRTDEGGISAHFDLSSANF
jgi:hypothetical protein